MKYAIDFVKMVNAVYCLPFLIFSESLKTVIWGFTDFFANLN